MDNHRWMMLCLVGGLTGCHRAESPAPGEDTPATGTPAVVLNGERMPVRWSDGDTFAFTSGPHQKAKVRLLGFNTLESYGPVHRWGQWTAQELFTIAKSSQAIGESRAWSCLHDGDKDGYGRLLMRCPDVAKELIAQGHAHVMAVDDEPSDDLLAAQREAQQAGRGIWKKGVPAVIVTSVHSAGEKNADKEGENSGGYNRIVDTQTGRSTTRQHAETYETCQEVCEGPEGQQSCMIYVPYERRYDNPPACLRTP